jgi:hypothetical protein
MSELDIQGEADIKIGINNKKIINNTENFQSWFKTPLRLNLYYLEAKVKKTKYNQSWCLSCVHGHGVYHVYTVMVFIMCTRSWCLSCVHGHGVYHVYTVFNTSMLFVNY